MDIFAKRQIDIAKKTLKMSDAGAKIMGGMTKEEAREILKKYKIKFNEAKDLVGKYLNEEYKSLGYMNDWGEKDPPSYTKCRAKNHKLKRENIGRCEEEISCPICKIYWKIDSSD